jgi:hypothetical protein
MKEIELDKEYVKSKIQEILNHNHSDGQKKYIREYPDRINFACPICGDSQKTPSKKRGNLYWKNMMYMCFNEDSCSRSFLKLMDTFDVEIELDKKINIYSYIDSNIAYSRADDNFVVQKLDKLVDINKMVEFFNNDPDSDFESFGPVQKKSAAYQYLKYDRRIENFENIYEAKYKVNSRWIEPVIIILNKSGDKVLGMQLRNLKSGKKRLFKIYNFQKLYNIIHYDSPLDEIEAMSYNKLSNFYNILNVDWDKPVTVFEGYLDSIFYPNSIGAIGIKSTDDMGFLLENDENLNIQFFFDQDNIGVRKSAQKLHEGYSVFLWQRLVEKLISNKKDKYQAKKYALKIKDLNKLVQEMKCEPYDKLRLWEYFSNDEFDSIYLDPSLYTNDSKKYYEKQKK